MTKDWRAAVAKHWGAPVPAHLKHGTNTWAAKAYGCPCRICLPSGERRYRVHEDRPLTRSERARRSQENLRGTPVPDHVKHGLYAHRVYGCRCDLCRKAKSAAIEARQNRWREHAHGRWVTLGDTTIVCWPPAGAGADWACPHCEGST